MRAEGKVSQQLQSLEAKISDLEEKEKGIAAEEGGVTDEVTCSEVRDLGRAL